MVTVSISETYDLSTKVGKMALIGVHTPTFDIIRQQYPGLLMNSKYLRFVSCDVALACASTLPADPQQIGLEAGAIAPQDMFNPILYKAVSNDSMTTLERRLAYLGAHPDSASATGYTAVVSNDDVTDADNFAVYYGLLSDRDGFRTAMPQMGLNMTGLVPIVFERYYNNGTNDVPDASSVSGLTGATEYASDVSEPVTVGSFRGAGHPMPRINCTSLVGTGGTTAGFKSLNGDIGPRNEQDDTPTLPPVYVAAIVMPPAKLTRMFYRMVVRWRIQFSEVRPLSDIASFSSIADLGNLTYHSDYVTQSAKMSRTLGMVDASNAELDKIMDGA
jgi:hypothetical protein